MAEVGAVVFSGIALASVLLSAPPAADPLKAARKELGKGNAARVRSIVAPLFNDPAPERASAARLLVATAEMKQKRPEAACPHALAAVAAFKDDSGDTARLRKPIQRARAVVGAGPCAEKLDALKGALGLGAQVEKWPLLPPPAAPLVPDSAALDAAIEVMEEAKLAAPAARLRVGRAVQRALAGEKEALDLAATTVKFASGVDDPVHGPRWKARAARESARVRTLLARDHGPLAGALDRAARDARQADDLEAPLLGLTPPYTRSAQTHALCTVLDGVTPGLCRTTWDKAGLEPAFRDLSRGAVVDLLPDEVVNEVQREYGVLLDRCALGAARKDPMVTGTRLELMWAVQPSGRADGLQLEPRRLRGHPVEACMKEALGVFRYPRYRSGERRVVIIALNVGG